MTLEHIDLYDRPLWAFEFHWRSSKDKRRVVELDAITGLLRPAQALMAKVQPSSAGTACSTSVPTPFRCSPPGGIAVKVARLAIDRNQKT